MIYTDTYILSMSEQDYLMVSSFSLAFGNTHLHVEIKKRKRWQLWLPRYYKKVTLFL